MNIHDAIEFANRKFTEHGLHEAGWRFRIDRTKRCKNRLGVCKYHKKLIECTQHYVVNNTEELVYDTILHEIAHALVGPGNGHNLAWRIKCVEVGAKPERCKTTGDGGLVVNESYLYHGTCACEGIVFKRHRVKHPRLACVKCKSLVTWRKTR